MLSETPLYSHVDAQLLIPEMALGSPSLAAGDTYTSFNPCCSPEATTACTKIPAMRQRGDATPTTLFAAPPPTSLAAARTPANTAATLLPSCEVPVAGAATGRGGEALSAPRHGFPLRLAAGQRAAAALASPRRDQGWTVVHPPTGGGRYFIYRPPWVAVSRSILNRWMRLISKGHPSTDGTLSDWTEAPSARTPSRRPAPLLRRPLRRLRRAPISP
jgi:hypothetical protein